jgi:hypothetical protein
MILFISSLDFLEYHLFPIGRDVRELALIIARHFLWRAAADILDIVYVEFSGIRGEPIVNDTTILGRREMTDNMRRDLALITAITVHEPDVLITQE